MLMRLGVYSKIFLFVSLVAVLLTFASVNHPTRLFSPSKPLFKPTPWSLESTKVVVLASNSKQDVSWLFDLPKDWAYYRYGLDYERNPYHDDFGTPHRVPADIGHEAMAYLTFIIDHYNHLPPYMVFVHGHNVSKHQPTPINDKLRALNLSALEENTFLNIWCATDICGEIDNESASLDLSKGPAPFPDGPLWSAVKYLPAFYKMFFLEWDDESLPPKHFAAVGGGQFAVTSKAIRSRTLEYWRSLRAKVMMSKEALENMDSLLRDKTIELWGLPAGTNRSTIFGVGKHSKFNSYVVGHMFERTWHRFFNKPYFFCPSAKVCSTVYFANVFDCKDWEEVVGDEIKKDCRTREKALQRVEKENEEFLKGRSKSKQKLD